MQQIAQWQRDLVGWGLQRRGRDKRSLLLLRCLWGTPEKLTPRSTPPALNNIGRQFRAGTISIAAWLRPLIRVRHIGRASSRCLNRRLFNIRYNFR